MARAGWHGCRVIPLALPSGSWKRWTCHEESGLGSGVEQRLSRWDSTWPVAETWSGPGRYWKKRWRLHGNSASSGRSPTGLPGCGR